MKTVSLKSFKLIFLS